MNDIVTKDEQNTGLSNQNTVTPMVLLEQAVSSGADLDKLEKLMALQERWEENEAKKAFNVAMAKFKKNAPKIIKDNTVSYQSDRADQPTVYKHATLAQVCEKSSVALSKYGLSHAWETSQDMEKGGLITVTCVITHQMGHSKSISLSSSPDASGKKNNIQAVGSTVSYLERYTLMAALGLAAEEQDDDGNGASAGAIEYVSDADMKDIREAAEEKGVDLNTILRAYKLESLEQMPLSWYADCMEKISKTKKKENK